MINRKIFFSYSRIDAADFALKLACSLRDAGIEIWIDQLDIKAGETWDLAIESALKNTDAILFVVSKKSILSRNVLDEVYYALDENKLVIPVIINNSILPFRIRRLQHIDFTKDYNSAFERLLKTVNATDFSPSLSASRPDVIKSSKFSRLHLGFIVISIVIIFVTGLYIYSYNPTTTTTRHSASPLDTPRQAPIIISDAAHFSYAKSLIDNHKLSQAAIVLDSIIEKFSDCPLDSVNCCYENGITTYHKGQFDYAFAWFNNASKKNDARSMCMLGNMFYNGEWVKADLNQAYDWYQQAEAYNNTVAILMLGIFCSEGKVVSKDLLKAKYYFERVVANSDQVDAKKIALRKLQLINKNKL